MDDSTKAVRKTYRKLTLRERLAVVDKLREVGAVDQEGMYVYQPGWADEKVCEALALENAGGSHVANVRTEMFGPVKRVGKKAEEPSSDLAVRIEAAELRIASLEARLARVESNIAGIVQIDGRKLL